MRNALYRTARILGDANAIRRGRFPQRIARRMVYRQSFRFAAIICRLLGISR